MASRRDIIVTGDIAGVATLPKQINYAIYRTTNDLLDRAQTNVVNELEQELHIRGQWLRPGTRYGINARFATVKNLEGSVGTAADWLLEEEGYNAGVKHPDKGGANLADPDIGNTRFGIEKKVRRDQKPRRLAGAFVKEGKFGHKVLYQRVQGDDSGNIKRSIKTGRPLRSRVPKRNTRLVLKYVLRPSVKVPQTQIVVKTATKTMSAGHYYDRFGKNLYTAVKTARIR